jgi:methylphosphotriester-DNA--protein-cysteine methyltransferase
MEALCTAAARSERMLQYVFRELFGVPPQTWFQAMKLSAVHRELRSKGPLRRAAERYAQAPGALVPALRPPEINAVRMSSVFG